METLYKRAVAAAAQHELGPEAVERMTGMDVMDPLSVYHGSPEAQAAMMAAENQLVLGGLVRQLEN